MTLPPPPPALHDLRAGAQLRAGLGVATILPDLDLETYSEAGYVWDDDAQNWRGPPGAAKGQKGLPVVGAQPYAADPQADIIWLAYDLKDGLGRRRWRPGLPIPQDLAAHAAAGGLLEAWNVGFERWMWLRVLAPKYGFPPMRDEQWRCAMAKARAFGLPGALGEAGRVLRLQTQKDPEGVRLMKRLSMPVKPTVADPRRRVLPVYDHAGVERDVRAAVGEVLAGDLPTPRRMDTIVRKAHERAQADLADTENYGRYCETDIASEAEASSKTPDLEGEELAWWQTHEDINRRGVHVDRASVDACIAIVNQAHAQYNSELLVLAGIDAASKVAQLLGWLHGRGAHLDSLDEEAVDAALARPEIQGVERRVLEIRAAVGSAAVKKLFAMRNRLSADDRLRDLYVYHGAKPGRSTGEGPQPTNLPRAGPDTVQCAVCKKHHGTHRFACAWCGAMRAPGARVHEWSPEIAEQALEVIHRGRLADVEDVFGQAMLTIAGCLRGLFDAAPGHELISTDFSSIEAVGLAMISGEKWRIEVFRTHGKIYEASAAAAFKVPLEEILNPPGGGKHPLRQKGKIGELAFGYQGWLGAARAFGMPGEDDEIKRDILAWRAASPSIEWLWGGQTLGKAFGIVGNAKPDDVGMATKTALARVNSRWDQTPHAFGVEGCALQAVDMPLTWIDVARLDGTPTGILFYCDRGLLYCRLPSGRLLHYHDVQVRNSDRGGRALSYSGWNTNPKNGPYGWIRMDTWGGRLVENIVQGTCRDILRHAILALEPHGYPTVLHVYDEIVAEVPEGYGDVEEFERIVTVPPAWASDWPIRAPGGYRARRYRKA